jgi:uncharacterized protein
MLHINGKSNGMSLIIDGYNLLHEAGIIAEGRGPGNLERSRLALLNFLAESLTPGEIAKTTVVFDAKDSPWGSKNTLDHRGIAVRFASRYPDADCLIEELILQNSSPRRLTVVSSDHRLQRAARRRKARAIDSDIWYNEIIQNRIARKKSTPSAPERPAVPLLAEDVEYWVRQFGGHSELDKFLNEELRADKPRTAAPTEIPTEEKSTAISKDDQSLDSFNPFPPGYGEDVEE